MPRAIVDMGSNTIRFVDGDPGGIAGQLARVSEAWAQAGTRMRALKMQQEQQDYARSRDAVADSRYQQGQDTEKARYDQRRLDDQDRQKTSLRMGMAQEGVVSSGDPTADANTMAKVMEMRRRAKEVANSDQLHAANELEQEKLRVRAAPALTKAPERFNAGTSDDPHWKQWDGTRWVTIDINDEPEAVPAPLTMPSQPEQPNFLMRMFGSSSTAAPAAAQPVSGKGVGGERSFANTMARVRAQGLLPPAASAPSASAPTQAGQSSNQNTVLPSGWDFTPAEMQRLLDPQQTRAYIIEMKSRTNADGSKKYSDQQIDSLIHDIKSIRRAK